MVTTKWSLDQAVVQVEGNIVSNMGDEKVMLSIHNGKYYNLGEIGGEIWELMKEPVSIKQIITSLLTRYQVETKECEEQVQAFISHLLEEDLVKRISEK
ncbi:hypothetical protein J14TS2_37090 [Bacillus sp. J14TS2]|uniref:lasso peptide biosynthesis PqqD family chaperone n=1 Tax=Bacillus sp. J14TS2 TaxID=2807188 RepID=UPI001B1068C5|nr:lasso peptide biosynthesis PqqD family chaperone [Bacillus sp. J14TS2]GIN73234.1 hypothetical protein J14TS2_37090 [Bacillus sp. J14TS2]